MIEQVSVAVRDVSQPSFLGDPETEAVPKPAVPVNDIDQCLEAIADLALDVGYFSDLILAERRLATIRDWIVREMARYEVL
ncbi:MAG: hypothetical protein ACRELG_12215 [Gemmataceae bacterium]